MSTKIYVEIEVPTTHDLYADVIMSAVVEKIENLTRVCKVTAGY